MLQPITISAGAALLVVLNAALIISLNAQGVEQAYSQRIANASHAHKNASNAITTFVQFASMATYPITMVTV